MNKNAQREKLEVSVYEVVGSPFCVAASDGDRVYERLATAINEGVKIVISFRNVSTLTTAFLNTAIGRLYGDFHAQKIQQCLTARDITNGDLALLKQVVDTAKKYYNQRESDA